VRNFLLCMVYMFIDCRNWSRSFGKLRTIGIGFQVYLPELEFHETDNETPVPFY